MSRKDIVDYTGVGMPPFCEMMLIAVSNKTTPPDLQFTVTLDGFDALNNTLQLTRKAEIAPPVAANSAKNGQLCNIVFLHCTCNFIFHFLCLAAAEHTKALECINRSSDQGGKIVSTMSCALPISIMHEPSVCINACMTSYITCILSYILPLQVCKHLRHTFVVTYKVYFSLVVCYVKSKLLKHVVRLYA